jgi:hypothetical protein
MTLEEMIEKSLSLTANRLPKGIFQQSWGARGG